MEREKTCCFTGHRVLERDFDIALIERGIEYMVLHGVDTFITGGALGFDTLAAEAVLRAKAKHPEIKLCIFAPCNNQDERFSVMQKLKYRGLLKKADYVDMPPFSYYNGCMKERNYKMVDSSLYCIAYYNEASFKSGTGQTYRYAKERKLIVYNLFGR